MIPGTEEMKFAQGENPKRFHGLEQHRMPWTRMGTAALLRETLYKAKNYSDKLKAAETDPSKAPEPDFKAGRPGTGGSRRAESQDPLPPGR